MSASFDSNYTGPIDSREPFEPIQISEEEKQEVYEELYRVLSEERAHDEECQPSLTLL